MPDQKTPDPKTPDPKTPDKNAPDKNAPDKNTPDKAPDKIVIQLPRPMPASNDCLPHAAMNLGAPRGLGLKPTAGGMVARLVIEPQMGAWVFYRLDANGGFVGDSWHDTKEDALHQAQKEFQIAPPVPPPASSPDSP